VKEYSERILKIGQYLTKLCVDYVDLLFLAHRVHQQCLPRRVLPTSTAHTDGEIFAR